MHDIYYTLVSIETRCRVCHGAMRYLAAAEHVSHCDIVPLSCCRCCCCCCLCWRNKLPRAEHDVVRRASHRLKDVEVERRRQSPSQQSRRRYFFQATSTFKDEDSFENETEMNGREREKRNAAQSRIKCLPTALPLPPSPFPCHSPSATWPNKSCVWK